MDWAQLLVGTGLGGILASVVNAVINRRRLGADADKVDAEAADVVTKTALTLVEPLRKRIGELEQEVETLRTKVRETTHELDLCRDASRLKDYRIREQNDELLRLRQQGRLPAEGT